MGVKMNKDNPVEKYINVKGINTRYWEKGNKGTDLILIHGIGSYLEAWENNIDFFSQNHRVFALDLPGFGRSDKPVVQYSFPYFSQFVLDFMDAQGIKRASLVGNSMGGGVSQLIAVQAPDRVAKLVLVNSAGFSKDLTILLRVSSLPLIGEILSRPSRKGTMRILKECVYDPSLITDKMVDLGYDIVSQPGAKKAFLTTLRSTVKFSGFKKNVLQSFADNYNSIKAPTIVIWGQQDRILPVSGTVAAEQGIPNVTVHIFDQCGHMPQIERPLEFNKIVENFLLN
jgi:4,5:9,10-diseco-3-hydroxy-5,9,17-trioxoandrosta-1(10),2-diene-4-oate hydrolase